MNKNVELAVLVNTVKVSEIDYIKKNLKQDYELYTNIAKELIKYDETEKKFIEIFKNIDFTQHSSEELREVSNLLVRIFKNTDMACDFITRMTFIKENKAIYDNEYHEKIKRASIDLLYDTYGEVDIESLIDWIIHCEYVLDHGTTEELEELLITIQNILKNVKKHITGNDDEAVSLRR